MSLQILHFQRQEGERNISRRGKKMIANIIPAFRQSVANGNIKFGGVTLQDSDVNRIHAIIGEIDSRRVFYSSLDDEIPRYAFKAIHEARNEIRVHARGIWATPLSEIFVKHIQRSLEDYCSKMDKLDVENLYCTDPRFSEFLDATAELRLSVWLLIAMLKFNLGGVLQPLNLPVELYKQVEAQCAG